MMKYKATDMQDKPKEPETTQEEKDAQEWMNAPMGKPIKTEKIEPIKVILREDHANFLHKDKSKREYMPIDENIEQLTNMINILIHRFNERGI
jgi:hypothetical protein